MRYVVEGDSHRLYELRFYKINHKGDVSDVDLVTEDHDGDDCEFVRIGMDGDEILFGVG